MRSASSSLAEGTTDMKNIQIISDKNLRSLKIKKSLLKIFSKAKPKKSNTTIVIGGDGFMLQTLKKNKNSKKHHLSFQQKDI